jgi:hypothetical protein
MPAKAGPLSALRLAFFNGDSLAAFKGVDRDTLLALHGDGYLHISYFDLSKSASWIYVWTYTAKKGGVS